MPKISTEDCKRAIKAAWPEEFGEGAENFKRVSKTGQNGAQNNRIVRVFYHRALPLKAIVVEESGEIVKTTFKGLAFFDLNEESQADQQLAENLESEQSIEFLTKHDLFSPEDFYFYVSDTPDNLLAEYPYWFSLVPKTFFERNGCMYDQEIGYLVDRYLPDDCSESCSCNFASATEPELLRAELTKRGFARSEKFDAFMNR